MADALCRVDDVLLLLLYGMGGCTWKAKNLAMGLPYSSMRACQVAITHAIHITNIICVKTHMCTPLVLSPAVRWGYPVIRIPSNVHAHTRSETPSHPAVNVRPTPSTSLVSSPGLCIAREHSIAQTRKHDTHKQQPLKPHTRQQLSNGLSLILPRPKYPSNHRNPCESRTPGA